MKLAFATLIAALSLSSAAAAGGTLYDCAVKQLSGPEGWISTRTALILDEKGGGQIIDSLTLYFETGPKPARIRKKGDDLILNWSFAALTDRSQTPIPQFSFRATLNTKTGAFKVRGKPAGFPQSMRGVGTCETRSNLTTRQLNKLLKG